MSYTVAFLFEVSQKSRLFTWHPHEVYQWVDVFYQYGAQVTYKTIPQVVVRCVASAQYQGFPVEDAALRIVP